MGDNSRDWCNSQHCLVHTCAQKILFDTHTFYVVIFTDSNCVKLVDPKQFPMYALIIFNTMMKLWKLSLYRMHIVILVFKIKMYCLSHHEKMSRFISAFKNRSSSCNIQNDVADTAEHHFKSSWLTPCITASYIKPSSDLPPVLSMSELFATQFLS